MSDEEFLAYLDRLAPMVASGQVHDVDPYPNDSDKDKPGRVPGISPDGRADSPDIIERHPPYRAQHTIKEKKRNGRQANSRIVP